MNPAFFLVVGEFQSKVEKKLESLDVCTGCWGPLRWGTSLEYYTVNPTSLGCPCVSILLALTSGFLHRPPVLTTPDHPLGPRNHPDIRAAQASESHLGQERIQEPLLGLVLKAGEGKELSAPRDLCSKVSTPFL